MNNSRSHYLNAESVGSNIPFNDLLKLKVADWRMRFCNGFLNIARKLLYRKPVTQPDKILIFRTGSLGDCLCAIPSIRSIAAAYPGATIDILTNPGKKGLVGLAQLLPADEYNEIIDYYGYSKKELFRFLKKKGYDLVVQLPQVDARFRRLLRDLLVFRFIAPAGLGWKTCQIWWFRRTQARHLRFSNELTRLLKIVNEQGGIVPIQQKIIVTPSKEDLEFAQQFINETGNSNVQTLVAIVVGAKLPQNRWPISYFKQVVEHLSDSCTLILIGANDDNALVKDLLPIKNVINACGKLTPLQSGAVISLCSLTISNDTGPLHLSYSVGTPTIGLFTSRDIPGKWYPPDEGNRVFRTQNVHCEACLSPTCNNNICIQAIMPQQVIEAAEEMLKIKNKNSR